MKCPKCGHEFEIEKNHLKIEDRGESQKKGMIKKFSEGRHVSRAPFGYEFDLKSKMLIPAQNSREVEEIFEEFLKEDVSLSSLAQKHKLSVNGLKKILRNFVYVGKVKFDGQIHEGKHKPIVSTILFNHVQDKLEKTKRKHK
ncbi:MAG: Recombinase [Candidatus Diapherotrites archaeon ADurb.Bin253]|jgi:site-specific DNA recombinase|nr:recombinase family protein [Candidatus Pacearchaeota archaeon]OQA69089.1 MAG: Recombinase [Candidatus Diapherotrites archaeon ADurb.Bin253]HNZ52150.1 recombinase family protein [Candidatus Pacearchaeota archaeon]HOC97173.1 recombinase family protein [Candidatus Pacearchaeota archaeon]HOH03991.1 recombinase family protein [Candidatus Pacearchaeota archaeon]